MVVLRGKAARAGEAGKFVMRKHAVCLALLSALLAPLLQGAAPQRGEIIGDGVYVNCQYRVAANFSGEPMFRDIQYRDGARTAPARQFYLERGMQSLSVTVVHFADGPERDPAIVDRATAALRSRGEVREQMNVWYDEPNLGGRQFNIALADGRLLRASLYMVDHRLYITEAISDLNDFRALLFSESVSLIDENGTDRESNPIALASDAPGTSAGLPPRQYDCSRLQRR
jgi:hypothetical protein